MLPEADRAVLAGRRFRTTTDAPPWCASALRHLGATLVTINVAADTDTDDNDTDDNVENKTKTKRKRFETKHLNSIQMLRERIWLGIYRTCFYVIFYVNVTKKQ